jgi:hypothetical protein
MANYGPASAFLLVGGRNITPDTYTLDETVEQVTEQTNSLGDSWEEHLPVGIGKVTLEAAGGLYETTTDRIMTALQEQGDSRQLVAYGFEGATTGMNSVQIDGTYAATWKRIAERNGLTKAHAVHVISGEYMTAKIVHGLTSEASSSGDSTTASVNHGAATTDGATLDLHLNALTLGGALGIVITAIDSADNVTFGSLVAFTSSTGAPFAERKTVTGTVEQYVAISWDFTESTSGGPSGHAVTPYVSITRG